MPQTDLVRTVERIERKLDELSLIVGYSSLDERGALIGSGVAGELARLTARVDARFRRDDDRLRYLAGAFAAASLFVLCIWWLVRPRLEALFQ